MIHSTRPDLKGPVVANDRGIKKVLCGGGQEDGAEMWRSLVESKGECGGGRWCQEGELSQEDEVGWSLKEKGKIDRRGVRKGCGKSTVTLTVRRSGLTVHSYPTNTG